MMRHWRRFFAKLGSLLRRGRAERELDREIASHLALLEDEFQRRGMSPADARLAALRAYGGVEQARELHREERSILWLEQSLQDIRFAVRSLLKNPGFASVAVLTLALGIGANVAIFGVVHAVLLRPLPFQQPERLVRVFDDVNGAGAKDIGMSVPELEDLRDRSGVFSRISAIFPVSAALSGGDHAERVEMLGTTVDYFQLLGAKAALGRVYGTADRMPGFTDGVVISDGLWQRQFGGDPRVLGRRIRVDEDGYTIIGVMPPGFRHPGQTLSADVELWAAAGFTADPFLSPPVRARRFLPGAMGRLRPGLTVQQAQQRLDALVAQLGRTYPTEYPAPAKWALRIEEVQSDLTGGIRPMLAVLSAAVGFVLLIVVVNMASLLVARSSARVRELAIRRALGASRARLVRQLLTESVLVSLAGGLAAGAVLVLARGPLLALMPADIPRLNEVHFDAPVLALAFLLSIASGILFGLTPALYASRSDPGRDLKEGGRSGSPSRRQNRLRGVLVTAEVALSVVLLIGAGLLVHSFWDALRVNPGFDPRDLTVARIWIPQPNNPKANRYITAAPVAALSREILRQAKTLPGFEDAAMGGTDSVPFVNNSISGSRITFSWPGESDSGQKQQSAEVAAVSPEFFRVLRTPLLRGRAFTDDDTDKTRRVAIVNESFVKKYLPRRDPGLRMRLDRFLGFRRDPTFEIEIVGVVGDIRDHGMDAPVSPRIYLPLYQGAAAEMAVFLRSASGNVAMTQALAGIVHGIDADLPVYGVRTMQEMTSASMTRRRFVLFLMAVFAALALFLAAIGIYGVMAYTVAQRAQEFGVRMALGAQPRDVVLLALRPGVLLTLGGVGAGLVIASGVARLMTSLLFGVSPSDLPTFLGVPVVLAAVALLACWIPARRATRIPPMTALRS
jgi:putative ABC transport system permease protein